MRFFASKLKKLFSKKSCLSYENDKAYIMVAMYLNGYLDGAAGRVLEPHELAALGFDEMVSRGTRAILENRRKNAALFDEGRTPIQ